jgi:hypothetical protein
MSYERYKISSGADEILDKNGEWITENVPAGRVVRSGEFLERYYPEESYHELKNFMISLGYEVVDPMSLLPKEQIELVNSASHIVTTSGSNAVHSLFTNPECIFTVIYFNTRYNFPYEHFLESVLGDRVNIVFDKRLEESGGKTYSASEVIKHLRTYYKDRI